MEFLENLLSIPLGYLMYFCYNFLQDYGWAIVLFTLVTKIILLPISIWVQKNSIKIVKITPEINHIKAFHFGDQDMIAEKTSELYKREKYNPFASIIPLLIQIVLLMGLVQVIYNPLTHLFHLPQELCTEMVNLTGQLTGADITSSSIQMTVVDAVKNPAYQDAFLNMAEQFPKVDMSTVLAEIQAVNMSLFGLSLGIVPVTALGVTLLMPVAAALAAWVLCIGQNRLNPLQAEQGKFNQIGMTLLSVGISLVLGAFVPLGVGYYWIWSNILSLIQQVILNMIINPKKHIDYEALEKSKAELAELNSIGNDGRKLWQKNPNAKRERADYKRFFNIANKHLVVYSEGNGYWKYFKDIVEYLLDHTNLSIHYITSDPNDGIFERAKQNPQIKPYYIGEKRLITLMMKMDADMVLMSTPDLENYHLKRSYIRKDVEYIYTNHGIGSDNLSLRTHALDHFDTIFCVGPHIVEEERALEKLYGLPAKNLVETGYCLIDDMDRSFHEMKQKNNEVKTILVAPSWQKDNLMDFCLDSLLEGIVGKGYRVIVRPHPQYVRIYPAKMQHILEKYHSKMDENFQIETDFSSNETVYGADILITDWSNIGYEFSFTTHRPTLYINTPMKVMNPEWKKIDVVPIDIRIRDQLGASIDVDKMDTVGMVVDRLIQDTPKYYETIAQLKQEAFYNLGHSAEVSGQYIIQRLKEIQAQKKSVQN